MIWIFHRICLVPSASHSKQAFVILFLLYMVNREKVCSIFLCLIKTEQYFKKLDLSKTDYYFMYYELCVLKGLNV